MIVDLLQLAALEQFESQATDRLLLSALEEYEDPGTTKEENAKNTPVKMSPLTLSKHSFVKMNYVQFCCKWP